jgi:hypothetical protein
MPMIRHPPKEMTMQYKTIVLEMIQQRPELYDRLRHGLMLLEAVNRYAVELKSLHETWTEMLLQQKPHVPPFQIANEALEIALQALQDFLPGASPPEESDGLSLDAAMAFARQHTPPA